MSKHKKVKALSEWWGDFDFKTEDALGWKIGPLDLSIQRLLNEWRVVAEYSRHFLEDVAEISALKQFDAGSSELRRFSARKGDHSLRVSPMLADRPVIVRPETPFFVPAGDEAFVYISSPLWIKLAARAGASILQEIPSYRISDTWFGSSPINGELCYASRTHARLRLEDIPKRPYRAVTAVKIDNNTSSPFLVQRIKIPIPNLSLFASQDGGFWTESMKFQMENGSEVAKVNIHSKPNDIAGKVSIVSHQRTKTDRNLVMRAFNSIF